MKKTDLYVCDSFINILHASINKLLNYIYIIFMKEFLRVIENGIDTTRRERLFKPNIDMALIRRATHAGSWYSDSGKCHPKLLFV